MKNFLNKKTVCQKNFTDSFSQCTSHERTRSHTHAHILQFRQPTQTARHWLMTWNTAVLTALAKKMGPLCIQNGTGAHKVAHQQLLLHVELGGKTTYLPLSFGYRDVIHTSPSACSFVVCNLSLQWHVLCMIFSLIHLFCMGAVPKRFQSENVVFRLRRLVL